MQQNKKPIISSLVGKKAVLKRKGFLPEGRHSSPRVVNIGGKMFVFKRSSFENPLTLSQAKVMSSSVEKYQAQLKQAGIRVSKVFMIHPVSSAAKKGRYLVASLEEYKGKLNAAQLIKTASREKAISAFGAIFEEVLKSFKAKGATKTNVGVLIDSKPKNYVIDSTGAATYIDFYTPKLLNREGKLTPFFKQLHKRPLAELQEMFQSKLGVVQSMLCYSIAERPELRRKFETIVLRRLRETEPVELISKNYRINNLVRKEVLEKIART